MQSKGKAKAKATAVAAIAAAAAAIAAVVLLILCAVLTVNGGRGARASAETVLTHVSGTSKLPEVGKKFTGAEFASDEPDKYYPRYGDPDICSENWDKLPEDHVYQEGERVILIYFFTPREGYDFPADTSGDGFVATINGNPLHPYGTLGDGANTKSFSLDYIVTATTVNEETKPVFTTDRMELISRREGYGKLEREDGYRLTVKNGSATMYDKLMCTELVLSGPDADKFEILNWSVIDSAEPGEVYEDTRRIVPKQGLAVGEYHATLTLRYAPSGLHSEMQDVSSAELVFRVYPADYIECRNWWGTSSSDYIETVTLGDTLLHSDGPSYFAPGDAGKTFTLTVRTDDNHNALSAYALVNGTYGSRAELEENGERTFTGSFELPAEDFALGINTKAIVLYVVHFNGNGGLGQMDDVNVDGEMMLPECRFIAPSGKEFDRWDVGKVYEMFKPTGDVTITALWKDRVDNKAKFESWWNTGIGEVEEFLVDNAEFVQMSKYSIGTVHEISIRTAPGYMLTDVWLRYADENRESLAISESSDGRYTMSFTVPNADFRVGINMKVRMPSFGTDSIELEAIEGYTASDLISNPGLYSNGLELPTANMYVLAEVAEVSGPTGNDKSIFTVSEIGGGSISGNGRFNLFISVKEGLAPGVYYGNVVLYYDRTGAGSSWQVADRLDVTLTVREQGATDAPPTEVPATDEPASEVPATGEVTGDPASEVPATDEVTAPAATGNVTSGEPAATDSATAPAATGSGNSGNSDNSGNGSGGKTGGKTALKILGIAGIVLAVLAILAVGAILLARKSGK